MTGSESRGNIGEENESLPKLEKIIKELPKGPILQGFVAGLEIYRLQTMFSRTINNMELLSTPRSQLSPELIKILDYSIEYNKESRLKSEILVISTIANHRIALAGDLEGSYNQGHELSLQLLENLKRKFSDDDEGNELYKYIEKLIKEKVGI